MDTKIITPGAHAVLDYITAGTFLAVGVGLIRRHPRASTLAFINGAAVLMTSLITDYPGGVFKKISFATHGAIDVAQAAMTATMPALMGFADDPEARFFQGQAVLEGGVVAMTDFGSHRRLAE
jgi:hypothetical protein